MKHLLFLSLLIPCCLSAQQKYIIQYVAVCKCAGYPNYTVSLLSLDKKIAVEIDILDEHKPILQDTVNYNGQNWWYRMMPLMVCCGGPRWQVNPKAQQTAYNKDRTQKLELINMGNSTIEYMGSDAVYHRKHILGMIFLTYPPIYSCKYCHKEYYPNWKEFQHIDSISGGMGTDAYFMDKWNTEDTSCLSSELALHKTENIWDKWRKAHKPGKYFLNQFDWMSTDGFVGSNNPDYSVHMAMGGRYDDSILLADKWYKFVPKKSNKHK